MMKHFWIVFVFTLFFHFLHSQLTTQTSEVGFGSDPIQVTELNIPNLRNWTHLNTFAQTIFWILFKCKFFLNRQYSYTNCRHFNADGTSNVTCQTLFFYDFNFTIPEG